MATDFCGLLWQRLYPKTLRVRIPSCRPKKPQLCKETTAGSDSVVSLHFSIPGGRASSAGFATSTEDSASSDPVVALYFAIPGGRPLSTGFATVVEAPTAMSSSPGQEDPALAEDTAISDSVEAPCFEVPGARASPAGFAAAVTSVQVVVFPSGTRRPSFATGHCDFGFSQTRYSAISRGRACASRRGSRRRICRNLGGLWRTSSCSASRLHTAAQFLERPFPGWVYGHRGRQQLSATRHGWQDPAGAIITSLSTPWRNQIAWLKQVPMTRSRQNA